MSKYLQKLEEGVGLFEEVESRTLSKHSSKNNSLISSKENKHNENEIIIPSIKYEEPQYQSVKNTYEVLKPIIKPIMELPPSTKKKVKTVKTIIQKEIIINNDEELNKYLGGEEYLKEEIPIPTKSTIQNCLKDSVIVSNENPLSKSNNNNYKSELYYSQRLKSKKNNLINHTNNNQQQLQNIDANIAKTQIIYNTNKLSTKNNNSGKNPNKTIMQSHNTKIPNQIKSANNKEVLNEQIKISYKDKNFIETYFHDNDIPTPNVCEGNALEFSELKMPDNEQIIKKSMESNNSNNHIKNMLDELPLEHTVILQNQPKIDMSKVQKENMLQKSLTSDKSMISNIQSINNNKYKSQNINFNNQINSKINSINNNNIINSMKMKKYQQKSMNEKPLPEIDMNNNIINNSITNSNLIKIKPKMELPINKNKINNNSNINNKSKMSFPSQSEVGSFISQTSMPENPFKNNTSYNKINNNN